MVAAGSITVAVRLRPPTAWEAARLPEPCYDTTIRGDGTLATSSRPVTATAPLREIVQIIDDRILTFDPVDPDRSRAFMERGFAPPGTKRYKDKRFMFDRVLDGEARQEEVYAATAKPLLNGLLDGYNATVFAYGATGCGKTHTISGTEADPGVIYLAMADLFQRIEDRKDEWNTEVVVTFLEIYNEEIRDLLAEPGAPTPRGGLQIREDKFVKVIGLVEHRPTTAEDVKQIQLSEQRTVATLSIIRLRPGSERAAATSNMGQRMVEGANINKSLLALAGGAVRHVPYRNSKLTRLLKFSLGGNLQNIVVTRNVVNVDRHVGQYISAENEVLKRRKGRSSGGGRASEEGHGSSLWSKHEHRSLTGASCTGKLSAAEAHSVLHKCSPSRDRKSVFRPLSSRSRSRAMPSCELSQAHKSKRIKSDSHLSRNMFEATLRAVCEHVSIENVKADATWRKAEMERVRAEAEKDAVKESFQSQAKILVNLLGMVGRCTVVLGEASRILQTAVEEGQEGLEGTVRAMTASLKSVAEKNDDTFATLAWPDYGCPMLRVVQSATDAFARQPLSFTRALPDQTSQPVSKTHRRLSCNTVVSPPRRSHKTPRKSLRSSIGQPYRRASDRERKVVQWKDEAGQGDLDDGGKKNVPLLSDERTDDSLSLSFVSAPNHELLSASNTKSNSGLRSSTTNGLSSLGSLQEADENASPARHPSPLSDRSMNCLASSEDANAATLCIPKKGDCSASPTRRLPTSAPKLAPPTSKNSRRRSNVGPVRHEKTRRRSSMIPQPSPPEDSGESSAPRRAETVGRSPAKRPKRMSLLANASRSLRVKSPSPFAATLTIQTNVDSIGADSSMRISKPTWR
ncbi:P-loop containing nucleoside triphosphate hydrolase protein [Pisolithus croceorrhizus]|nr:P-loop containing nucleoside triphosphate hydrolase protein [Pisolithus croceorrhizus]